MAIYSETNQPSYTTKEIEPFMAVDFKIIAKSEMEVVDFEDPCEPAVQTLFVEPVSMIGPVGVEDASNIIARHFTGGCSCAHDCCGHRFSSASVEFLKIDLAKVEVHSSRNY